jgi:DNA topoisomerase I
MLNHRLPTKTIAASLVTLSIAFLASLVSSRASAIVEGCQLAKAQEFVQDLAPADYARKAGLNYTTDRSQGITRQQVGEEFHYLDAAGRRITDQARIDAINKLQLPPAYSNIWISPDPKSHLQATGVDKAGRTQYRYHPDWITIKGSAKFRRMAGFGLALPDLRATVNKHLAGDSLTKDRVVSGIIRLLDLTAIRVGNEEYAETNETYGLSTMLKRHVVLDGNKITFDFVGKSSKEHQVTVEDPQLAQLVKALLDVPGDKLFQHQTGNNIGAIDSADVNAYINVNTGLALTAKDFRTWRATVITTRELMGRQAPATEKELKAIRKEIAEIVAQQLGNTPSVALANYIYPALWDIYAVNAARFQKRPRSLKGLTAEENLAQSILEENNG